MTDNEIKKALECCIKSSYLFDCKWLAKNALDYINRLEAEKQELKEKLHNRKAEVNRLNSKIRSLKANYEELAYKLECLLCTATGGKLSKHTYPLEVMESYVNDTIQDYCEEAEAEAYKEFAERLKELLGVKKFGLIDNLLKEMESESNG